MPRRQYPRVCPRETSIALVLGLLLLGAQPAAADSALIMRYGGADSDYERIGLGLRLAPVWSADLGRWKARLHPEVELSHFRYTGPATGPDNMEQGGIVGQLRLQRETGNWRPYGELGLGLSLFSEDQLGQKRFSTHFQFSQHLGLGVELAGKGFAGYQYSHYSNADIDTPNDGIDVHQAVVGVRF